MRFDPSLIVDRLQEKSPALAHKMTMLALSLISPFNAHLRAKLLEWTPKKTRISVDCHRGVKNHVGTIHAGALFTLGETCAGLIVIRNFNFKDNRPLMSEVEVIYHKQARGKMTGVCEVSPAAINKANKELKEKKVPFIPMKTQIFDEKNTLLAEVKTKWQVKPWKKVRSK